MIIRPAFRVELKMHVRRADGSREVVWLPINESFDGQTVVKALQEATEAGCNEVGRNEDCDVGSPVGRIDVDCAAATAAS